jgi:peptidoglycan/xylan/chitin deacetylase (PgdA/CDA1 family)
MIVTKLERAIAGSIPIKPFWIKAKRGIVSFTFDDFPKSAAENGNRILTGYGFFGTYYCAANLMGREERGIDYFDGKDLTKVLDAGHELGCHTWSHLDCQSAGREQIEQDLERNCKFLEEVSGQPPFSFSYPFGKLGVRAKVIAGRRFITARGISGGVNAGLCDFAQLKANSIYSGSTEMAAIKNLIAKVEKKRGWLIFYTHDLSATPSPFGCTLELFESVVRRVANSNCEVLPVKHAVGAVGFSS